MRGKIICWGKALGDSMLPLLSPGVKLLIIQTDFNNAKIGDILCFRKQGYVVHRLIRKSQLKNTFITKGDNSVTIDNPFTEKELIGKVQKIIYSDNKVIDLDSTIAGVVNYLLAQLSWLDYKFPPVKNIRKGRRTLSKLFLLDSVFRTRRRLR